MANTVTIKVDADTAKAESNVKGMGEKFRSAMKGVAMAAGALTLAAGAAAKLGQEFQESTNIIARGTGATGEQLEELTELFRSVWKEVPQDAATVAGALADINTEMGLEGEALETMTKAFLDFSRAMDEDVGTAITTVADAMEVFNVPFELTQSLLNKLTVASQASGLSVIALAGHLETFGPILKNAGFTIEESTAIFANLEAAGIGVTRVMPAMNGAIKRLAADGVTDIKTALLGQIEAIKGATSTTEALNIATSLFGSEGAQRFMVAIRNGALELDVLMEAMENSDNTLEDLAETTLTMSDKFDILKNRMKDALVPFGNFATMIGPMVIMIPTLATGIAALAGAQWLATAATWAQAKATTALTLAMSPLILPLILAAAAITALIVVGLLIVKNWDTIKEKAGIVWHAIGEAINSTVNFIIDKLNWMIGKTNEAISLWLTPLRAVLSAIGMFIPKAAEFAKALESVIPEIGEANIELTKFGERAVPTAHDAIIEATDVAREMGGVLDDTVTPAIKNTTEAIVGGVMPALVETSGVINDEVIPSLAELTTALADEIGKSVEATQKADELQHALFVLESQQAGVTDAYVEGLLKGSDIIEMYEKTSQTINKDLIPSLKDLTAKLADEIGKSITAKTKAGDLQHALFILESQQDGVRDAYIEGLITGADVIQMYKDMSATVSEELVPSLQSLTDALAKDIEKSVSATEKATLLQHALFILEAHQEGVKDAFIEGTLSADDVIKMYENMELTLTADLIPAVEKVEDKFGEMSASIVTSTEQASTALAGLVADWEESEARLVPGTGFDPAPAIAAANARFQALSPHEQFAEIHPQWLIDMMAAIDAGNRALAIEIQRKNDPWVGMAHGGIVTSPTLAMIGERGPEAVIPLGRGGGGIGGLTINIMGPTYGMDDFADRVAEAIRDGARRGGFEDILQTA